MPGFWFKALVIICCDEARKQVVSTDLILNIEQNVNVCVNANFGIFKERTCDSELHSHTSLLTAVVDHITKVLQKQKIL